MLRAVLCAALLCAAASPARGAPPRRVTQQAPAPGAAPAPGPAGAAPHCTASGPLAPRQRLNVSMDFGGRARFFLLELPDAFDTTPAPLLIALHGAGGTVTGFLDGGAPRTVALPLTKDAWVATQHLR